MASLKRMKAASLLLLGVILFGGLQVSYAAPKAENHQVQAAAVSINKASAEELQSIRGVGPATADRIIQYRTEHGKFDKLEDLVNVRGIGSAKFEKMKNQISL